MEIYTQLVQNVKLPRMVPCRQIFERPLIDDIPAEVRRQLDLSGAGERIKPNQSIAITAGSRGISNIATITKTVVDYVKEKGANPFIFPAMGSHGGATAEGQRQMIEGFGITEEAMGCPIRASMDVVEISTVPDGRAVCIDKLAHEADGIIVVCRIKPHTAFSGPYESGVMKMLTIGLGKQYGAEICHSAGFKNMAVNVPLFGKEVIKHARILSALAVIENGYDETAFLHGLRADQIEEEEPRLLDVARKHMGSLQFGPIDLLIIDEIGKNISGDGADPLVMGRFLTPYTSGGIKATKRVALSLTKQTHGNACGIGLFDATTRRLFNQMSLSMTYPNAVTNTELSGVMIPMIMESDKDCISVGYKSCNGMDLDKPRVIRIKNTKEIETIWISEAMIPEAEASDRLEIIGEPEEFPFDAKGNLALENG